MRKNNKFTPDSDGFVYALTEAQCRELEDRKTRVNPMWDIYKYSLDDSLNLIPGLTYIAGWKIVKNDNTVTRFDINGEPLVYRDNKNIKRGRRKKSKGGCYINFKKLNSSLDTQSWALTLWGATRNAWRDGRDVRLRSPTLTSRGSSHPTSLIVYRDNGWRDFCADAHGWGLLSLYKYIENISDWQDSARQLVEITNTDINSIQSDGKFSTPRIPPEEEQERVRTIELERKHEALDHDKNFVAYEFDPEIHTDEALYPENQYKYILGIIKYSYDKNLLGLADSYSAHYNYFNEGGDLVMVVLRGDTSNGKIIRPFCCTNKGDDQEWVPGALAYHSPLYKMPQLLANPDAPVILVEGEKAADALEEFVTGSEYPICVTAFQGGVAACRSSRYKVNFSPLSGRNVYVLCDNDAAGETLYSTVSERLAEYNTSVTGLNPPSFFPEKWDVADGFSVGTEPKQFPSEAEARRGEDWLNYTLDNIIKKYPHVNNAEAFLTNKS